MLFNSFQFLTFLFVIFILYYQPWRLIQKNQLLILLMGSMFFYAYQKPVLLLLLITSMFINSYCSFIIYKIGRENAKKVLWAGIIFNVGILAFFKYSPLIAKTLTNELNVKGDFWDLLITVPLPIGISFYTFEGICLLVDLYKGKTILHYKTGAFKEHLEKTAMFISFFPHLIAGPILKAHEFYPQFGYKKFVDIPWEEAMKKIILGYFLKMVVADNLNTITQNIAFPYFQGFSSGNLALLLFGYSMQIFADFAGYSLIAIGLGLLFGYRLPENFNFPYIAASFAEFWRRWHISLSTWLRDYLYIPFGGNRKGKIRTYLNLFMVMLLGGLWHGAAWSYAIWGAMHGIFLMAERFLFKDKLKDKKRSVMGVLIVFSVVTCLWLLFKLTDFSHVVLFIKCMMLNSHIPFKFGIDQLSLLFYSSIIVGYHIGYLIKTVKPVYVYYVKTETVLYGLLLFFIITSSGAQGEFIYFQF